MQETEVREDVVVEGAGILNAESIDGGDVFMGDAVDTDIQDRGPDAVGGEDEGDEEAVGGDSDESDEEAVGAEDPEDDDE
jgi:hypothetical protein